MILYHYCSLATFLGILDSKVLWLSDLTASNDDEELKRTFKILWDNVRYRLLSCDLPEEITKQEIDILDKQFANELLSNPPYGICFCKFNDELFPWCEYGDLTKGVSLGFEINWFQDLQQKKPHPNTNLSESIGYDEVIYDNQLAENEFFRICYEAISYYGPGAWFRVIQTTFKHYSAFIKNPKFNIENEYRIVYYPLSSNTKSHDFSIGDLHLSKLNTNGKTLYSLPWMINNQNHSLRKITRGHNCEMKTKDLENIISKSALREVDIVESNCSYRNRN